MTVSYLNKSLDCSIIWTFLPVPDDPYYCGLRARIPNFVKARGGNSNNNNVGTRKKNKDGGPGRARVPSGGPMSLPPQIPSHPFWWHSRLYSGGDAGQMSKYYSLELVSRCAGDNGHSILVCAGLGSSDQAPSTTNSSGLSHHYKQRNPTNYVPYITGLVTNKS